LGHRSFAGNRRDDIRSISRADHDSGAEARSKYAMGSQSKTAFS